MTQVYDADGQLTSESDPNSAYGLTYNGEGNVTKVDNAGTPGAPHLVLTYAYDDFGNKTSVHDNFGTTITYAYNGNNLIDQRVDGRFRDPGSASDAGLQRDQRHDRHDGQSHQLGVEDHQRLGIQQ